ncbi:MAG TPA: FAD-dependent oxidoreductase, partial [Pyrinomonadaceae bacterium]|nr:FAD-dependent oxidoreductase [Pyrinomonadaceae bacterium]
MSSAEVVIVGGGVIGASVAYHLAARGLKNVLVLERGAQRGEGSTGRATGGFRAQFATPVNIRLSLLSREKLLAFRDETGVDPCFRQHGYLFIARSTVELDALLSAQSVQHECGLAEARAVSAEDIKQLNPAVESSELVGGVFCPTDGFIRPLEILRGYTEAAARLGLRFEYGVALEGFRMDSRGRIESLRTNGGEVSAGSVVNAAGAWAAKVARLAGIEIPITPLRRQVAVTRPFDLLPKEMPMTIFVDDGFHLRVRDRSVLLLWPDEPKTEDPFDTSVEDAWVSEVVAKARARVPCLKGAEIDRDACWAGLYEMSPDRHALVGVAPGMENFYLANGSSGH